MITMTPFDLTKHRLVPKHSIVSESEKKKVLEKYKITLKELPKITLGDPVVEQLKAKEGDVIKIVRNSETAGETVYYRVVIRG
jgi:DNA-directed RNA polymerase subunit H